MAAPGRDRYEIRGGWVRRMPGERRLARQLALLQQHPLQGSERKVRTASRSSVAEHRRGLPGGVVTVQSTSNVLGVTSDKHREIARKAAQARLVSA
jgi:hypothetical protein